MGAEPVGTGQFPDAVATALAGKRFGLIGFDEAEADRALQALEGVRAFGRSLELKADATSSAGAGSIFDICVLKLNGAGEPAQSVGRDRPLLLVGSRAQIAARNTMITNPYSDIAIS
jgi:hypothetical protein